MALCVCVCLGGRCSWFFSQPKAPLSNRSRTHTHSRARAYVHLWHVNQHKQTPQSFTAHHTRHHHIMVSQYCHNGPKPWPIFPCTCASGDAFVRVISLFSYPFNLSSGDKIALPRSIFHRVIAVAPTYTTTTTTTTAAATFLINNALWFTTDSLSARTSVFSCVFCSFWSRVSLLNKPWRVHISLRSLMITMMMTVTFRDCWKCVGVRAYSFLGFSFPNCPFTVCISVVNRRRKAPDLQLKHLSHFLLKQLFSLLVA